VELIIDACMSTKGFRMEVYKVAEACSAMTNDINSCIRSVDEGLVVTVAFEPTMGMGAGTFIGRLRTLCEFRDLEMSNVRRYSIQWRDDNVYIGVQHYVPGQTESPPGSRQYARSRSSEESLPDGQSDVTKLDSRSDQVMYQALEAIPAYIQMDSAHIMSSSDCKGTPIDSDGSNRFAMTPNLHRAFDGTSDKHPVWVRIRVERQEMDGLTFQGQVDLRYRVHLVIDFPTKAHAVIAAKYFDWKAGTVIGTDNTVRSFVFVVDPEVFCRAIEWKFAETTETWKRLRLQDDELS